MKKMYKVIVAMMIMVITAAPVIAGNNVDKNARPNKKEMRMTDRKHNKNVDKSRDRHAAIEIITFKVSNKAAKRKNVVVAAKAIHGVKDVKWNPRNNMMTVTYDANKTTAYRIKAAVN